MTIGQSKIDTRLTHAYLCLQHYIHVYWLGHIIERQIGNYRYSWTVALSRIKQLVEVFLRRKAREKGWSVPRTPIIGQLYKLLPCKKVSHPLLYIKALGWYTVQCRAWLRPFLMLSLSPDQAVRCTTRVAKTYIQFIRPGPSRNAQAALKHQNT